MPAAFGTPAWTNGSPAGPVAILRLGSKGGRVTHLQQRLAALRFHTDVVDGIFGPRTVEAVKAFQRANGLVVDGVAGPKTLSKLDFGTATFAPPTSPLPKKSNPASNKKPAAPAPAQKQKPATPASPQQDKHYQGIAKSLVDKYISWMGSDEAGLAKDLYGRGNDVRLVTAVFEQLKVVTAGSDSDDTAVLYVGLVKARAGKPLEMLKQEASLRQLLIQILGSDVVCQDEIKLIEYLKSLAPKTTKPQGPVNSQGSNGLLSRVISTAESQANQKVREVPKDSNRGPEVDEYLRTVGLDPINKYPWCAAFVYWCFQQAATGLNQKNPLIKTAGCMDHWTRAGKAGIRRIKSGSAIANPTLVKPGMIFIMDHGGGKGHTGIVKEVNGQTLVTIEGNTDPKTGTREGGGVYQMTRKMSAISCGFIDYSPEDKPGSSQSPASKPAVTSPPTQVTKPGAVAKLTPADFEKAAKSLGSGVSVAIIRAFAEVESGGKSGFGANGLPIIAYEGHIFRKLTRRKDKTYPYDSSHPMLSYPYKKKAGPQWQVNNKDQTTAWKTLTTASALDHDAALQACSWGMFQVMGFNYAACGYTTVDDFVAAMKAGEAGQLDAFVGYCKAASGMVAAIKAKNFVKMATLYNGEDYGDYDKRIAKAYKKYGGT